MAHNLPFLEISRDKTAFQSPSSENDWSFTDYDA